MKFFKILFLAIVLSINYLSATKVDSLLNVIKKNKEDSLSLKAYVEIITLIKDKNQSLALRFANEGLVSSRIQKNDYFIAFFSSFLAEQYELKADYNNALKFYEESLNSYQKLDSLKRVAELKNNIGRVYEKKSIFDKAIVYYIEGLKIREKIKDKKGIASSYNSIGLINYYQSDYDNALKNFNFALTLVKELKNPLGLATIYNNFGLVYIEKKQYDSALTYINLSLKYYEQIENWYGIATAYSNLAICYYSKNDLKTAEKFYLKSIKIKEEIDDKYGLISSYISLTVLYQKKGLFPEAIATINKAIELAKEVENNEGLSRAYQVLAELYSQVNKFDLAYKTYIKFYELRDSIYNDNTSKIINSLQEQFQSEKREKDIQLANSKIKQQSLLIYGASIVIALILSLTVIILRNNRQRKRANKLLSEQNEEITIQKEIIEQKNHDILASITYAKRIQEAILPLPQYMSKYLNMFVLFKPKDIVSGDFYWFMSFENHVLFAVVDCTGHGVPGAFMSIVGYNSLNQVIKEYNLTNPGLILDKLNILVQQALHTDEQEIKDGMDISLCSLNVKTKVLQYAGANNPLYIVRQKEKSTILASDKVVESYNHILYEIKANAQPIGAYIEHQNFKCHEINLEEGDSIYIFSDGFADQFGGPIGKKLKYKPFKEFLLSIQAYKIEDQRKHLQLFFDEWKGNYDQIDDVCIMGIRV